MKGLLIKDFYMISRYCRSSIIVAVSFIIVSFFSNDNTFFIFYPAILIALIPSQIIAYDEKEKWHIYSEIFPYSRNEIVSCKYITGFILNISILIFSAAAQLFRMINTDSFVLTEYLSTLISIISIGIISQSIMLPFIFKFGMEKGRILYFIVIVFFTATIFTLDNFNIHIRGIPSLPYILGIIMILGIYAVSWILSIKFYKKREF